MKFPIYILLCFSLVLYSCNEAGLQNTATEQEEEIAAYLEKEFADATIVFNDGVNRVILTDGHGQEAAAGDSVFFKYQGGIFNKGKVSLFSEGEFATILGKDNMIEGLEKGISGMKVTEEAYIIFSSRYGYWNTPVSVVPAMSALIYYIYLQNIKKN